MRAEEQLAAQFGLEGVHELRDSGLRAMASLGGLAEAALLHCGHKHFELSVIHFSHAFYSSY